MPTKLIAFEIGQPLPAAVPEAERYDALWLLAFQRGVPVGCAQIDNARTPVSGEQIRSEVARQLGETLAGLRPPRPDAPPDEPALAELLSELRPEPGRRFRLSVVVCTYDRPRDLRRCLQHLTRLDPGRHGLELIVVDNHPVSGQTEPVVRAFPQVRYVAEPRGGVAYARNAGLRAATGDIVASIDDDVVAPPGWPARILAPFADPRVMCVSGLVLPLELETASQERFEQYGGLGRGFAPRVFGPEFFYGSPYVVHTWDLGGTANVALRRAVLAESGLFDETLGPGQPTGVGEDIYMFYRILKARHLCYYEPAAYVWHRHRADDRALERQLFNYSKGQVSYQLRTLVTDGDVRVVRQLLYDLPRWHAERLGQKLKGYTTYPLRLMWLELRGNLAGLAAFPAAVRAHRRLNGPGANPITPRHGRALGEERGP